MGSIDIFLFYSQNGRPKTQRKSITARQSNRSCWERGRNGVFLCPNRKDRELNICTFSLVCLYSRNAVNVVQLTFISQRTLQVSSYNFSHIRLSQLLEWLNQLCIISGIWEENDWTCGVLTLAPVFINTISLELLLTYCFVCLKEDEASWWIYQLNGHQVLHYCLNPSDICCEDCIHEQLYCDSSDVTARKRNWTTGR